MRGSFIEFVPLSVNACKDKEYLVLLLLLAPIWLYQLIYEYVLVHKYYIGFYATAYCVASGIEVLV